MDPDATLEWIKDCLAAGNTEAAKESGYDLADMDSEIFYGNDRGRVLGPYDKGEIQPQLRAVEMLRGEEADRQVYAVPARSLAEAEAKLQKELRREADKEAELS